MGECSLESDWILLLLPVKLITAGDVADVGEIEAEAEGETDRDPAEGDEREIVGFVGTRGISGILNGSACVLLVCLVSVGIVGTECVAMVGTAVNGTVVAVVVAAVFTEGDGETSGVGENVGDTTT
jgi:hypothetical protein